MIPSPFDLHWTSFAFAMFVIAGFVMGLAFPYIFREIRERRARQARGQAR